MRSGIVIRHLRDVSELFQTGGCKVRRTHCPLHREETEEEGQASIPSSSVVCDTVRAEDILGGVHLISRGLGEEGDDNT